jgi:hypothetical protein
MNWQGLFRLYGWLNVLAGAVYAFVGTIDLVLPFVDWVPASPHFPGSIAKWLNLYVRCAVAAGLGFLLLRWTRRPSE